MGQTVEELINSLSQEQQEVFKEMRTLLMENLPSGFQEIVDNKFVHYVVPLSLYPAGYHVNPSQPLPFISIAMQKNYFALYHLGIYAIPELLEWFVNEYKERVKTKLDMGKSCIRFKKLDQIPFDLMKELVSKMTPEEWINIYENIYRKGKSE